MKSDSVICHRINLLSECFTMSYNMFKNIHKEFIIMCNRIEVEQFYEHRRN